MIGGFFPFSQKSFPVHLFSGGVYTPPPGQYVIELGRVTQLQFMDGYAGLYRAISEPSRTVKFTQTDGCNYRLVNMSGVVSGVSVTTAGSAGTNGIGSTATSCSVSFGTAPTTGIAATAYPIVGGAINSTITITTAGTGLTVPPTLVFDPPPAGGIAAAAYCTLTSDGIGAVTVTNQGAGYTVAPNCYVIPAWGSYPGATIAGVAPPTVAGPSTSLTQNAIMTLQAQGLAVGAWTTIPVLTVNATLASSGALTGIVMLNYGNNYVGTAIPTISFTGGPTSAAATAIMSFSVTSVTVSNAGVAVSTAPTWVSSAGLVLAHNMANEYYGIRPARGISTLSSTTTTIITSNTVEDPGFGLQKVPVIGYQPAGGTAWTTNPAGTAVCGGIADTSMIQPAVA